MVKSLSFSYFSSPWVKFTASITPSIGETRARCTGLACEISALCMARSVWARAKSRPAVTAARSAVSAACITFIACWTGGSACDAR